jgi:hypothetical protein
MKTNSFLAQLVYIGKTVQKTLRYNGRLKNNGNALIIPFGHVARHLVNGNRYTELDTSKTVFTMED